MNKTLQLSLSGLACAVSVALTAGAPAYAQDGPLEEVLVTGSRIMRSGMQTPTPVTVVTSEQINQLAPGLDMVDALSELPQFLNNENAVNRGSYLGAAGGAFLNLRGIGTNRTLVLLNGHRVPPSDLNGNVDTNQFPRALVQRIDTVTGGASAAYGADALSGAVNFILNTRYEGFTANAQGGQTKYGDGDNVSASFAGGLPLSDRLHLTFSVERFHHDQVQGKIAALDDRDWFEHWGFVGNPDFDSSDPPGTNPQRLIMQDVHSTQFTAGGKINQPGFAFDQHTFFGDGTQTRLFVPGSVADPAGTLSTSGGPEWEVARLLQRHNLAAEVERRNFFANLDFQIDDRTTAYFRAFGGSNNAYLHNVNGGLAPSLMGIWHATIYRDNAFLSDDIRQAMDNAGLDSFRMDKGGFLVGPEYTNYQDNYTDANEVDSQTYSLGFSRDLANDWTVSAIVQHGTNKRTSLLDNVLRIDRQAVGSDAVEVYSDRRDLDADGVIDLIAEADRGTGEIVCNVQRYNPTLEELQASVEGVTRDGQLGPEPVNSPVGTDGTIEQCVPFNILGWGNATPEAADYLVSDKGIRSELSQTFIELLATGEAFDGWYAGPLSFSVGANYRSQEIDQQEFTNPPNTYYDTDLNRPEFGIRGVPDGHASGRIQQFAGQPEPFDGDFDVSEVFAETYLPLLASSSSRSVGMTLAARHSSYSRAGAIQTWKVGLDAQLSDSVRLRGTLSHDAREAAFEELFVGQRGGGTILDPWQGGIAVSTNVRSGGNPNLKPEEADTLTAGIVYAPTRLPGLEMSLDYYDIDLSETIGTLGAQRVVDSCHDLQLFCELIEFDEDGDTIRGVTNTNTNINNARVSGTDVEVIYNAEPDLFSGASESLSLRFLAGFMNENSTTPLGGLKEDMAGAENVPDWTTTTSLNYNIGPWTASIQHRAISSTKLNVDWVEGVDIDNNKVEGVDYVNLGLRYALEGSGNAEWQFFANIVNAFDEHPPRIATNVGRSVSGSTGFSTHRAIQLGRRYVVGATFNF